MRVFLIDLIDCVSSEHRNVGLYASEQKAEEMLKYFQSNYSHTYEISIMEVQE